MNKIKFSQLGWVVALAMAAFMAASGFQAPTEKMGVADLQKIVEGSDFYHQSENSYNAFYQKRKDLVDYFKQYPVMTSDQINRYKELSLKDTLTPQESAELERIKADVKEQDARNKELQLKANPTPEERTLLQDFAHRQDMMNTALDGMNQDFANDLQQKKDQIMSNALDKARAAVQTTGKAQGYTIVFSSGAAIYAANDITQDSLKTMNATH